MTVLSPKNYRFISQRQRMSPFPNYMSMESVAKEMKKYTGISTKDMLLFFEGNLFYGFQDLDSYNQVADYITKKILKDPKFPAKMVKLQKKFGQDLVNFTKKAHKSVSQKVTNQKLYQLFAGYEKRYKPVYAAYGWIWDSEEKFSAQLLKIIEGKINNQKNAIDIFNVLTQEPTAMVAAVERKALLELALKIAKIQNWQKAKRVEKLIKNHVKKYFWVVRDYDDPIMTFTDVVNRLGDLLKGDVKQEYQALLSKLKKNEADRQNYFKELKLSQPEMRLFSAMRDIAYLKELRKTHVSQSLYYFDKVLEEIGRRLYLSINQVRFFTTKDVYQALVKGKDLTTELNERFKLSLWRCGQKGTQIIIGSEAQKHYQIFCQFDKNQTEFYGLPVSPGIARGPAKIVMNPNEVDKVQKGDIIVSVQVVPSFSTAIIKSAGLICDGGHGITSHPATLAREAGIPCVIQTRFARKVIKDGDIVEVDGYKGVARIISRN